MWAFNLIATQPESTKTIRCKLLSHNLSQRRALPLGSYEKIIGSSQRCEAGADCFEKIVIAAQRLADDRLHGRQYVLIPVHQLEIEEPAHRFLRPQALQ
jgi:hypothetical protein